jgi:hypothetical protein
MQAAETLESSVFIEPGEEDSAIHKNAKALLVKFLLRNGSVSLKGMIGENEELQELVDITTREEGVDDLTKRLIKVSRALKYV